MAATHSFQRFETSGGAHVFRLPVEAFPNFWAYAYLVLTDDLRVLIDTGSGSDQSIASLDVNFGLTLFGIHLPLI